MNKRKLNLKRLGIIFGIMATTVPAYWLGSLLLPNVSSMGVMYYFVSGFIGYVLVGLAVLLYYLIKEICNWIVPKKES